MKTIEIKEDYVVQVDDEDYERINQFRWYIVEGKGTRYAYKDDRNRINNKTISGSQIAMHRFILNLKAKDKSVDHKDGNGLNNQKANLRKATTQQNCFNVPIKHNNKTSEYKGVYKTESGKFEAQIKLNYKSNSLGRYKSEVAAAKVYDAVARFYMKEFAYCNFDIIYLKPMSIEQAKARIKLININIKNKNNGTQS